MPESPLIFDRALIRRRQRRARALGAATFLLDRAADDLVDRLGAVLRRFEVAVGPGTPRGAARATQSLRFARPMRICRPQPRMKKSSSPTKKHCRFATARSISSSPR